MNDKEAAALCGSLFLLFSGPYTVRWNWNPAMS